MYLEATVVIQSLRAFRQARQRAMGNERWAMGHGGVKESAKFCNMGQGGGQGGVEDVSSRVQAGSEWKSSRILALEDDPGIPQHVPGGVEEGSRRGQGGLK